MRLACGAAWVIVLVVLASLPGAWAQVPSSEGAGPLPREGTLFEFERETARRYGVSSNPAVLRMTREQYLQAVGKLHAAFRPTAAERRAAQLYGTWRRKADWDDVADRWRRKMDVLAWGIPWKEARVLPWAPVVDLVQQGWGKGEVTPAPPDSVPGHYLVVSLDFRGVYRSGIRRPFPAAEALKFSLAVDERPSFAQAGETREGRYASKTFVFFETVDDGLTDTRGNRRPRLPETVERQGLAYSQDYRIVFDLLQPDGMARVGPEAKTLRLTLREGGNEAAVTFELGQWQPASFLPGTRK